MGRRTAIFRPSASDLLFFAGVLVLMVWIYAVARKPFLEGVAEEKNKAAIQRQLKAANSERLGF